MQRRFKKLSFNPHGFEWFLGAFGKALGRWNFPSDLKVVSFSVNDGGAMEVLLWSSKFAIEENQPIPCTGLEWENVGLVVA